MSGGEKKLLQVTPLSLCDHETRSGEARREGQGVSSTWKDRARTDSTVGCSSRSWGAGALLGLQMRRATPWRPQERQVRLQREERKGIQRESFRSVVTCR